MNGLILQSTWHGLPAWVLENEALRTIVVQELGAKLVSLFDKRSQKEWLADPGDRAVKKVAYGAVFTDQDMSGWDEMFPTIVACEYPLPGRHAGALLPDHGEVWALPWKLEPAPTGSLTLSVEGIALPYRLTRRLAYCAADVLQMDYGLENLGDEPMPYIWAAHPQFLCGEAAEIRFPFQVSEVCNTVDASWGWGEPETIFTWPAAVRPDGTAFRIDHTGPPTLKQARKFYVLPEKRVAWAGLLRQPVQDWLRLDWDPEKVPYLGLWVDEGALSHTTVAAPEPTTGFYDSLVLAWEKKEITVLEPHATQTWTLTVRLGIPGQPFPDE
ncbi:MAG TPA: hypothetical protein VN363_07355 [Anaerolineales bacterium]|nr:hypothetical protein [Anaerolineales bacterium]